MGNLYRKHEWLEYRSEVIELDGGICTKCGRSEHDGVTLQVHHTEYSPGSLPWDYPYEVCETLCKGCHAEIHGKIRPSTGWDYLYEDDLGDLVGSCDLCGTDIRYVYYIDHPKWEALGVGTLCCDHLTGTEIASNLMESRRRYQSRLKRFLSSKRWTTYDDIHEIKQKKVYILIEREHSQYRIYMDGYRGGQLYSTLVEAKRKVFESLEDGSAHEYLEKRN